MVGFSGLLLATAGRHYQCLFPIHLCFVSRRVLRNCVRRYKKLSGGVSINGPPGTYFTAKGRSTPSENCGPPPTNKENVDHEHILIAKFEPVAYLGGFLRFLEIAQACKFSSVRFAYTLRNFCERRAMLLGVQMETSHSVL